jgi:hypothetical protein
MDDYSSLAHRIAGGLADVRGCLILSRDGLILGSYPEEESAVKPSWLRFATLGEPERSFVEFAGEVWAYLRRGPYAAFAVAGVGVRPGLLLDQLEQVLMAAEEARTRRDTLKVPESSAPLSGKPRTSLHPPVGAGGEPGSDQRPWSRGSKPEPSSAEAAFSDLTLPVAAGSGDPVPAGPAEAAGTDGAGAPTSHADPGDRPADADHVADPKDPGSDGKKKHKKDGDGTTTPTGKDDAVSPEGGKPSGGGIGTPVPASESDPEVDRVLLAKEFSGLLQVETADDEAQS